MNAERESGDEEIMKMLDKGAQSRLEKARERWREEVKVHTDPLQASERLTASDYAIRINAKG